MTVISKPDTKPYAQFDDIEYAKCWAGIFEKAAEATRRINAASLQSCGNFDLNRAFVGHSGGKDSVVVDFLARAAYHERDREFWDKPMKVVHNPKTTGPNKVHPLTREFLYESARKRPIVFASLEECVRAGYTTQIDGTRISEFDRGDGRSTNFVRNGAIASREELTCYVPNGLGGLNFIYPIYDWTDMDVWAFIDRFNVSFSDEYLIDIPLDTDC
ncbi:hypothetical protein [Burkholderia phage BCSR5]|nr:hypothetical protein [Burkholderia phage BCSR5]